MAGMNRTQITVELNDGSVHGPERVIFADKMRLEKTARASNWDMNRDEFRVQSFLAWAALSRIKVLPESTGYEQFLEQLVDVEVERVAGPEDSEDPTPADTSA